MGTIIAVVNNGRSAPKVKVGVRRCSSKDIFIDATPDTGADGAACGIDILNLLKIDITTICILQITE